MVLEDSYPRDLKPLERELLLWVLPDDRSGYREYRSLVQSWQVAAAGRRGEGNFILAPGTWKIDGESPLPQVFAYGVVEQEDGRIAVTVRERLGDQLEFEIVNLDGERLPTRLTEKKGWTYSEWLPNLPCPICSGSVREVAMRTEGGRMLVLAVCTRDGRIWVYDERSRVNHPIPLTNFYNELMLHANVRDPNIALNSRRLFTDLQSYSDATLSRAFASYNSLKTKITIEDQIQITGARKHSLFGRFRSRLRKQD